MGVGLLLQLREEFSLLRLLRISHQNKSLLAKRFFEPFSFHFNGYSFVSKVSELQSRRGFKIAVNVILVGEEAHKNQGPTHLQKDTKNGTAYNGVVLAMLDCKKYLTDLGFGIISISLLIFYTEATPFFLSQNEGTNERTAT